jgi:hypothetical protein
MNEQEDMFMRYSHFDTPAAFYRIIPPNRFDYNENFPGCPFRRESRRKCKYTGDALSVYNKSVMQV